jgi:hypothetical protein
MRCHLHARKPAIAVSTNSTTASAVPSVVCSIRLAANVADPTMTATTMRARTRSRVLAASSSDNAHLSYGAARTGRRSNAMTLRSSCQCPSRGLPNRAIGASAGVWREQSAGSVHAAVKRSSGSAVAVRGESMSDQSGRSWADSAAKFRAARDRQKTWNERDEAVRAKVAGKSLDEVRQPKRGQSRSTKRANRAVAGPYGR